jgi:hypothetical protein
LFELCSENLPPRPGEDYGVWCEFARKELDLIVSLFESEVPRGHEALHELAQRLAADDGVIEMLIGAIALFGEADIGDFKMMSTLENFVLSEEGRELA